MTTMGCCELNGPTAALQDAGLAALKAAPEPSLRAASAGEAAAKQTANCGLHLAPPLPAPQPPAGRSPLPPHPEVLARETAGCVNPWPSACC